MSEANTLSRELGLFDIIMFGIGGIVGAGIYAIIGEAAVYGGNMLWLSFLLAAFVALLTAATYAELVSRFPDAGGSFEYVKQAFGLRIATIASVFMLFTGVVAAGAIAISFSDYLTRLFDVPSILTTVGVVVAMGIFNAAGAAQANWFNTMATVVTLVGLAGVVAVSFGDLGSVDLLDVKGAGPLAIGTGSALIFFSFIGFEDLVKMAEETKNPSVTLPRGLMISAVAVLVIYLFIAVAAVSALGGEQLSESSGPLAEIVETKVGSGWASALIVVALFATSKTILSNILGASRLLYDVGRDTGSGLLQRITKINSTTSTPIPAIIAVTILAIGFGAIGDLGAVAAFSNITIMLVFLIVNASLIRVRRAGEGEEPPFSIPGSIGGVPVTVGFAMVGIAILLALNVRSLLI